jgi:hypothetical protein
MQMHYLIIKYMLLHLEYFSYTLQAATAEGNVSHKNNNS